MIAQRSSSHHVTDCPICGCPVEIQSKYIGHEVACGHCRGNFVVNESAEDGLAAARLEGSDQLDRAEQVLRRCGEPRRLGSSHDRRRLLGVSTVLGDELRRHDTSLEAHVNESEQQPTALLVEHRDEVFARLESDLAESGMCVVRAESVTEALQLCGEYEPDLVVANVDLADQSGWLLAGKLRFVDQRIHAWLYQPKSTSYDAGMADFLQIKQLVDYGGDLLGLSEAIIRLLASRRELHDAACDTGAIDESAAA